ncbi:MAG: ParB N-terminal domain-containing protein [Patescibacteria group bacterium]|mgnify:FL=1
MKTDRFQVEVILIKDILVHEELDPSNSKELINFLKKSQTLSNPIIVASLGGKKYLQLDGMNRIYSFKTLGLKTISAQIVDYNDQEKIELSSWLHILKGDIKEFLNFIKEDKSLVVSQGKMDQVGHRYIKEKDFGRLCSIVTNKKEVFFISTGGNFSEKIKRMNYLVYFYKNNLSRGALPYTLNHDSVKNFFKQYPNDNIIVIFPTFTPQQVIESAKSGVLLPTGITRHLVKGRVLNIDLPLSLFNNKKPLKEQNEEQDKILLKKRSRLYEEATVNFE